MGTLTKIQDYFLGNLNNSEYANHLNRFRALFLHVRVVKEDSPATESASLYANSIDLGFSDEMVDDFDADLRTLYDIVNQSHTSDETALLVEEDKRRDELIVYFTTIISKTRKSPIAEQKNAAISLYNQVKPYVGIYKLADQQETQQINGLLIDMDKEPNKSNVTKLGLAVVLDELRASNDRFIELTTQRTEVRATSAVENSKDIRMRLDPLYEDMILLATATHVVKPTAETTSFLISVNALIDETKARYNQRVGIAKANKNKKPENDKPIV